MMFDASGTFFFGATLSGTVTIDTTNGTVTAANLVTVDQMFGPPGPQSFTFIQSQGKDVFGPSPGGSDYYGLQLGTAASGFPELDLVLPTATLVNYPGGFISSTSQTFSDLVSAIAYSGGANGLITDLSQGSFTPVPEPASLTLLGIGAFGMMGYAWRRRRQQAA
jgi:hypothetical protein